MYNPAMNDNEKLKFTVQGFSDADIQQMELASSKSNYMIGSQPADREAVINLIGRDNYWDGISRSAFHRTALRFAPGSIETGKVITVFFDSGDIFPNKK